jgi:steroid delta-isomerase-like uncharacterized protein
MGEDTHPRRRVREDALGPSIIGAVCSLPSIDESLWLTARPGAVEASTAEIAERYFDSWNSHHAETLLRFFGRAGVYWGPLAREGLSGELLAEYAMNLWSGFPDLFIQPARPLLGRGRVTVQWALRGTYLGDLFGCPATGKSIVLSGIEVIDWRSGAGLAVCSCYDALDLLRQLELPSSAILPWVRGHLTSVIARSAEARSSSLQEDSEIVRNWQSV